MFVLQIVCWPFLQRFVCSSADKLSETATSGGNCRELGVQEPQKSGNFQQSVALFLRVLHRYRNIHREKYKYKFNHKYCNCHGKKAWSAKGEKAGACRAVLHPFSEFSFYCTHKCKQKYKYKKCIFLSASTAKSEISPLSLKWMPQHFLAMIIIIINLISEKIRVRRWRV